MTPKKTSHKIPRGEKKPPESKPEHKPLADLKQAPKGTELGATTSTTSQPREGKFNGE